MIPSMNLSSAIAQLKQQKAHYEYQLKHIEAALAALEGINGNGISGRRVLTGPRRMSAAARARIVAAQKARWAKWRKQQKRAA